MATPVFCCGFECGVLGGASHFSNSGGTAAALDTTIKRSGSRSIRMNPAGDSSIIDSVSLASSNIWVARFYVYFTTLPNADTTIFALSSVSEAIIFKVSDSKIYAGDSSGFLTGATGVAVTTGQWYRIDVKCNHSSNPRLTDVSVDGVACGQYSKAAAGAASTGFRLGFNATVTCDAYFDDALISHTSGDYPLGAGKVEHFIPTSDGTHNIAGTGDFQRTVTGTDILNATTTAYQLVDDVPLESGSGTDWINMLAPPNATDYVECIIGPASGISTPTVAPRAVEVIAGIRQSATGNGNMEIRLNDNGTMGTVYTATTVAGVTTIAYKRAHFADPPSAATVWNVNNDGSNGDFRDLRVRFGSPGALDVNPDQYFTGIMIEAEFPAAGGTIDVDPATYTFTTEAAGLQAQRKLDVTNAAYTFTGADVTFNKGYNFPVVEAVYSFAPADVTFSVTRMLIVTPASYSFTTQDAGIQAQRKLNVDEAVYSFTTADAGLTAQRKLDVTNAVYSFTPQDAGLLRGLIFNVDPASYSFSTADASILAQRTLSGTEAVYLFTTQDAGLEYTPGSGDYNFDVDNAVYSFNTADAGLTVQRLLNVDPASYSFTTQDASILTQRTLSGTNAVYVFTTEDASLQYGATTVFNVDPAVYSFTGADVSLLAQRAMIVTEAEYDFETQDAGLVYSLTNNIDFPVIRAKYRFNTKTAQLIGPKRPGLIRMYNE